MGDLAASVMVSTDLGCDMSWQTEATTISAVNVPILLTIEPTDFSSVLVAASSPLFALETIRPQIAKDMALNMAVWPSSSTEASFEAPSLCPLPL